MSKKDYILAVLEKVSTIRWPANNIKKLLEEDGLTDEYVEYLYVECVHAVNEALDEQNSDQQNTIISKLTSLKDAELKQNQADQEDIKNLEKLIANI